MKPYMFDETSALEYQRLDLMSRILDPWTRGYLDAIGVGPGWRCLELGGGNGSVSEWLYDRVGPSGSVTAGPLHQTTSQTPLQMRVRGCARVFTWLVGRGPR